jgi:uncharacterized OsmC-like protein
MAEQVNDVNVEAFKEFREMVKQDPALGKVTIKATSSWHRGTKTLIEVGEMMHAKGQNLFPRTRKFWVMTDDPAGLGGVDAAATAVETLVAALAGCVTAGIASNAAMFDVPVDGIGIDMEADINLNGMLGIDRSARNGISDIRYTVTIQSSAPEDKVRKCKETIDRKSPVRDTIANPVNIASKFVYKPR